MSQTKNFNLPDLGEGLPDATIVEWFVKEGDVIKLDEPLVSMETAKAVVEVPSPFSGKVLKLSGGAGDIIPTGSVLASFELDPNLPQRADGRTPATAMVTLRRPRRLPHRPRRRCRLRRSPRNKPSPPQPSAMTPVPWSAPCRAPMLCMPNRHWPSVASRPCQPCVRWRASWAWT